MRERERERRRGVRVHIATPNRILIQARESTGVEDMGEREKVGG